jgi:hypothetical protein
MSLEYRIGGRRVSKQQWERHVFQDEPRRIAREEIESKLRTVRCPVHGQTPRVTYSETPRGFDLTVEGCCSQVEQLAENAV